MDGRVVDRVEAPEERDLVAHPVDPVDRSGRGARSRAPAWAQNGSAVTSGRNASPGSQASERMPITTPTTIPAICVSGVSKQVGDVGPQAQAAQRGAMARPQLLDRPEDDEQEHEHPDRLVAERDAADDRAGGDGPAEDAPPHAGFGGVAGARVGRREHRRSGGGGSGGARVSISGLSGSPRRLVHGPP